MSVFHGYLFFPANNDTSELLASKDLASKDLASKDLASKDLASKDFATKDLTSKDLTGKDLISRDHTSESFTSVSIHNWIHKLQTPLAPSHTSSTLEETPPPSYTCSALKETPTPLEDTRTRRSKRRRDSDSLPSVFLGDGPSFRKRHKALQEMAANMQPFGNMPPFTPPTDRSSSKQTEETQTPSNISPSKATTGSKGPKTPYAISQMMGRHGLLCDHTNFTSAKYTHFKKDVMAIIDGKRASAMKRESAEKLARRVKYYQCLPEATFMHHFFPILLGFGYTLQNVTENFTAEDKATFARQGEIYRDLMDDEKIASAVNQDFVKHLLPNKYTDLDPDYEAEITKALAKTPGMTNPRPNYIFGLRTDKEDFQSNQDYVPQGVMNLLEICAGMYHTFFILEGKGVSGSATEAQNQARRGGATLVNASRQLEAMVRELPDKPGIDEKSFVFSATLCPQTLQFWVHWYEGPSETQRFHMNMVKSFDMHNTECYPDMRRTVHNILSWGANERVQLQDHKTLHTQINTYARRQFDKKQQEKAYAEARTAAEKAEKAALKTSSSRKKRKANEEEDDQS